MEKLALYVIAFGIVGLAILGGSFWLMHSAINAGNVWQGLFAGVGIVLGIKLTLPLALIWRS